MDQQLVFVKFNSDGKPEICRTPTGEPIKMTRREVSGSLRKRVLGAPPSIVYRQVPTSAHGEQKGEETNDTSENARDLKRIQKSLLDYTFNRRCTLTWSLYVNYRNYIGSSSQYEKYRLIPYLAFERGSGKTHLLVHAYVNGLLRRADVLLTFLLMPTMGGFSDNTMGDFFSVARWYTFPDLPSRDSWSDLSLMINQFLDNKTLDSELGGNIIDQLIQLFTSKLDMIFEDHSEYRLSRRDLACRLFYLWSIFSVAPTYTSATLGQVKEAISDSMSKHIPFLSLFDRVTSVPQDVAILNGMWDNFPPNHEPDSRAIDFILAVSDNDPALFSVRDRTLETIHRFSPFFILLGGHEEPGSCLQYALPPLEPLLAPRTVTEIVEYVRQELAARSIGMTDEDAAKLVTYLGLKGSTARFSIRPIFSSLKKTDDLSTFDNFLAGVVAEEPATDPLGERVRRSNLVVRSLLFMGAPLPLQSEPIRSLMTQFPGLLIADFFNSPSSRQLTTRSFMPISQLPNQCLENTRGHPCLELLNHMLALTKQQPNPFLCGRNINHLHEMAPLFTLLIDWCFGADDEAPRVPGIHLAQAWKPLRADILTSSPASLPGWLGELDPLFDGFKSGWADPPYLRRRPGRVARLMNAVRFKEFGELSEVLERPDDGCRLLLAMPRRLNQSGYGSCAVTFAEDGSRVSLSFFECRNRHSMSATDLVSKLRKMDELASMCDASKFDACFLLSQSLAKIPAPASPRPEVQVSICFGSQFLPPALRWLDIDVPLIDRPLGSELSVWTSSSHGTRYTEEQELFLCQLAEKRDEIVTSVLEDVCKVKGCTRGIGALRAKLGSLVRKK